MAQTCSYQSALQKKKKKSYRISLSLFSFDWEKSIWAFCAIHKATFLPLSCQILKQAVQNPSQLISLDVGVTTAVLYWGWSSTSKKTCDKSNKSDSEASVWVKYKKKSPPQPQIKGNDLVWSFSSDKKDFLVPSLKLNSWNKLTSYCALCNLRLLLPTRVILLRTGLFVEEIWSA